MIKVLLIGALFSLISFADVYTLKKCNGCHGDKGMKKALGASVLIGDMTKEEIASALNAYKKGTKEGAYKTIMMGFVADLNESDIISIAQEIGK